MTPFFGMNNTFKQEKEKTMRHCLMTEYIGTTPLQVICKQNNIRWSMGDMVIELLKSRADVNIY